MILDEYMQEQVEKYCNLRKISLVNGRIPSTYANGIRDFINYKLRRDRLRTRNKKKQTKDILPHVLFSQSDSPIEVYLARALQEADLYKYCQRQLEIGRYRVDYAFPFARLVVECDGKDYHHTEKIQIERDQKRDKYLARKGWRVLHIEGLAIRRNIELCIDKIRTALSPFLKKLETTPPIVP